MRVKVSKQPPPAPTASAVGPCPTIIQIVGRPGTERIPSAIAPPDCPRQPGGASCYFDYSKGWSGGAKVLGKLPLPERPTYLDYGRTSAYCACSGYGWGLF